MIKILIVGVMFICGLISLVIPKEKLYNPEKVKTEQDKEKVIKQTRTMGIIFIIVALIFVFVL